MSGQPGTRECSSTCTLGACVTTPAEVCNGRDDDGDCLIDEICTNLLTNGSFDAWGIEPWTHWVAAGYAAAFDRDSGVGCDRSNAKRVDVTVVNQSDPDCGGRFCVWKIELRQYGFAVVSGQHLRVSFRARADANGVLMSYGVRRFCGTSCGGNCVDACPVGHGDNNCCWEPYGGQEQPAWLTTNWQEFTFTFGPIAMIGYGAGRTRNDGRLFFTFGVVPPRRFWLDEVRVEPLP